MKIHVPKCRDTNFPYEVSIVRNFIHHLKNNYSVIRKNHNRDRTRVHDRLEIYIAAEIPDLLNLNPYHVRERIDGCQRK